MLLRNVFFALHATFHLFQFSLCQMNSDGQFPQFLSENVRYTYFSITRDQKLRGVATIKRVYTNGPMSCLKRCSLNARRCLSVNFKKRASKKFSLCELLSRDKHYPPEDGANMQANDHFEHFSIELPVFSNCAEIYKDGGQANGIYRVKTSPSRSVQVYCDMVTSDGGWTVIQKRQDGSVYFFRRWVNYKMGFGNKLGEYWLGLDTIHTMTSQGSYRLRVDMEDFKGNTRYVEYDSFYVADETENYRLKIGSYSGTDGDSLTAHSSRMFSTKDRDNDMSSNRSCASERSGGWWYTESCGNCNPNGVYGKGITWSTWLGDGYSLKRIEFKIRPVKY